MGSGQLTTTTNALVELKEKFPLQINKINMDSQEIRDRYYGGEGASRDAFEELCALYDAIQHEREENREAARAKMLLLRERNQRLREKYAIMVDAYNNLAEEAHDRSDSSSSSDSSDGEDNCCIM